MSIQSKHFLNNPETLVVDSLQGLCTLNPQLALDEENKVVYLASQDRSKVALICGGGSGHEPAHAGFVGDGILAAAVCGSIFASPNASQVRRGIDLAENEKGTVIIVKNYTGDILNFGLAKEQYAAQHPDKADRVKFVIVGEDVAVGKTQGKIVGRRGLAGTVLVYKIAGALAKRGASLDEVYSVAQWVASNVGTIGVGLEHCHVPGTASGESHLGPSEIEIGMGIHNEPGHRRLSPVPPLKELLPQLIEFLTVTTDADRSFLPFRNDGSDRVVLLVNNLGGVSELELTGVVAEARRALEAKGVKIERVLAGTFMTSLNMPGFSITTLLLPHETGPSDVPHLDSLILSLLDEPANAPGWKWSSGTVPPAADQIASGAKRQTSAVAQEDLVSLRAEDTQAFNAAVERACNALIAAEPEITRMDNIAGDGDCGLTLKAGASAVLKGLQAGRISGDDVVRSVIAIAQVAEEEMGGTSGALYSIFFSALAQGLQAHHAGAQTLSPALWSSALTSALAKLYTYTRARPPSRTLVDPLATFIEALAAAKGVDFAAASNAAGEAALKTRDLEAKAGRSAYVEGDRLREERVADPGAWGVKVILEGILGQ
ncbi:dihydroxyacetone kinase [Trametes versicolor FP-101664 SS1]|uniref:dihydroxyacetone kinase n=1 Tax=Trametes versicolor (strain FP-101664) TaxID=717944 RepID=UPI0004623A37|nr:dihydroxyacetone kinase [Trametes versicolor FP-101664 SS1]EIW58792.1 dihydroxyacetone kinase [Trametes versicolor FP-101664 SS1]